MEELFEDIERLAHAEKRVAMATLVATRGTSPKREGAKMWVGEEGRILGSVTIGGCVDARVIAESEQALSSFSARLVEMKLGNEDAWAAIQELNKNTLKGEDKTVVVPGMKLKLPAKPVASAQ